MKLENGNLKLDLVGSDGLKWPETFDGQTWAKEFIRNVKDHPANATDEGTMIGWFANAIMVGYDRAISNTKQSVPKIVERADWEMKFWKLDKQWSERYAELKKENERLVNAHQTGISEGLRRAAEHIMQAAKDSFERFGPEERQTARLRHLANELHCQANAALTGADEGGVPCSGLVGTEHPHPMLCFQHGGSEACEAENRKHGFTCPKCSNAWRQPEPDSGDKNNKQEKDNGDVGTQG